MTRALSVAEMALCVLGGAALGVIVAMIVTGDIAVT